MKQQNFFFNILPLFFSIAAFSQAGTLDNSFSGDGKVITPTSNFGNSITSMAVQSDGKLVVAGFSLNGNDNDFTTTRYNIDGSLDATFGGTGIVKTNTGSEDIAYTIAIQGDGKIVVAGTTRIAGNYDFAITRYNSNGTLDTTFDGDGIVITPVSSFEDRIYSIAIQNDGKILAAGGSGNLQQNALDFAAARYNTDGTLDITFNGNGKVITSLSAGNDRVNSIAIQNDGKILLAGYSSNGTRTNFAISRFNTDGTLDPTFDSDGKLTTDFGATITSIAASVAIQSDAKIVVAGYTTEAGSTNSTVVRYTPNGELDVTFNGSGKVITPIGVGASSFSGIKLQSDNKIIAAGYANNGSNLDFALVRYNIDASLDVTFNNTGKVLTDFANTSDVGSALCLYGSRIFVGGRSTNNSTNIDAFSVASYKNDGTPLPIHLTSFVATKSNNNVILNWASDDQNVVAFEIEKSTDGRTFYSLETIKSIKSTFSQAYTFIDHLASEGPNYYRLKLVNKEGFCNFSQTEMINNRQVQKTFQIFPNPVTDILYFQTNGNEKAFVTINDALGRKVRQKEKLGGASTFSINVRYLKKGKHYLIVVDKEGKHVEEFLKL